VKRCKPQNGKVESNDALCRGGGARSSDEVAVMAMEQRGTVIQLDIDNNCESRRI